jgi:multiple sugar transport system substrate-binding protein
MPPRNFGTTPFSRRTLVRNAFATGVGLIGLDLLAACGPTTTGGITVVTNDLPPQSNPNDVRSTKDLIASFQKLHSQIKIDARNDPYNPQTFLAKAAAHSQEDVVDTYFTEPQLMIQKKVVADVTSQVKSLSFFNSYMPSALSIVTGSDGKIYGLPYSGYALGVMYSRKIVKAAGLNPDNPPKTWDDFRTYAAKIAATGVPGYIELTKDNNGGWHLANWIYTGGGTLEETDGGKTRAIFNNDRAVLWLKQLQAMKHTDKSLYSDTLVGYNDGLQAFAAGKAGMIVEASDVLLTLKSSYNADLTDIGLWPMPQNGGNSALAGGHVYVFKAGDKADTLNAAIEWAKYYRFDLGVVEQYLSHQAAAGLPVGGPASMIFRGDYQQQLRDLIKKYANLPQDNYAPFVASQLNLRSEPSNLTQKLYGLLDSVVQAVLTDAKANPKTLLDSAAQQFQGMLDAG